MFVLSLASVLILSGCNATTGSKENLGTVVGAALGGLVGSQFGSGDGKTASIVTGIFLGGLLGKDVGATLDRVDKQIIARTTHTALENSPVGSTSNWNNPDTGNSGTVTPIKTYQTTSGYCREFQTTITVGGKVQNAYGTACRQPDGSWRVVN